MNDCFVGIHGDIVERNERDASCWKRNRPCMPHARSPDRGVRFVRGRCDVEPTHRHPPPQADSTGRKRGAFGYDEVTKMGEKRGLGPGRRLPCEQCPRTRKTARSSPTERQTFVAVVTSKKNFFNKIFSGWLETFVIQRPSIAQAI